MYRVQKGDISICRKCDITKKFLQKPVTGLTIIKNFVMDSLLVRMESILSKEQAEKISNFPCIRPTKKEK
ncbi:MAG: hypothetical protein A3G85_03530 [Elusimicrobia bacterium RIFCSPLOWO2_12_FULL_39_28]|nr:MAG: hypothetical protein A3G85_03530 [Elusimicrobia bacterium RIFCSPLOWO2_12_FULL_39_28]